MATGPLKRRRGRGRESLASVVSKPFIPGPDLTPGCGLDCRTRDCRDGSSSEGHSKGFMVFCVQVLAACMARMPSERPELDEVVARFRSLDP